MTCKWNLNSYIITNIIWKYIGQKVNAVVLFQERMESETKHLGLFLHNKLYFCLIVIHISKACCDSYK